MMRNGGTARASGRARVARRPSRLAALAATVSAVVAPVGGVLLPAARSGAASPGVWLERKPLDIAHAGGDLEAPHETMYAFKRAVAVGADVLEMDLRLSADGELMVIHDDTVARTTEGTGRVEDLTAGQMQALDNAYWFVPDCWSCHDRPAAEYFYRGVRTGEVPPPAGYHADDFRIPTLREVLETFPDRLLDLEIKVGSSRDGEAARALAAMLREYGRTDDVIVVSFGDDVLREFHDAAPEVATSPGLAESTSWFFDRRPLPARSVLQVPPTYSGIDVVTPAMVADAHAVGLAVWVWLEGNTQENEAFYSSLLDMGVDGIIASKPVVMERTLRRRGTVFTAPVAIGSSADPVALSGNRLPVTLECPERVASRCEGDLLVTGRSGPYGRTAVLGRLPVRLYRGERTDALVRLSAWAGAAPRAGGPTLLDVTIDPANADTGVSSASLIARR